MIHTDPLPEEQLQEFHWKFRSDPSSMQILYYWRDNEDWKDSNSSVNFAVATVEDLESFFIQAHQQGFTQGQQFEKEQLLKIAKKVEQISSDEKEHNWCDHCSCLRYTIDLIERPGADRFFTASSPESTERSPDEGEDR